MSGTPLSMNPTLPEPESDSVDPESLATRIKTWGRELGFQQVGITDLDPGLHADRLQDWLDQDYHGDMDYMARHASLRQAPQTLVPGALRLISVRMDYLPGDTRAVEVLQDPALAYVSRYALGRDYHKVIRKRLQQLADQIQRHIGPFGYRAFVDSAPVLERAFAEKSGLGWIGKNTMLINRRAGSWFFLGELFTDLPLPVDVPATAHCGSCTTCLDICPTGAFVGAQVLDARRCISYLTIELKGAIPLELRPLIGNRIYGCDDCQLCCPWNKFAPPTTENDFSPRHDLDRATLLALFAWTESEFLERTAGSPIRRTGYEGWLRNIAVALGNAPGTPEIIHCLTEKLQHPSALVREHVQWALDQHHQRSSR